MIQYYLAMLLLFGLWSSAEAASKFTMPEFGQEENTCFPTSAANLLCWFGENGYPGVFSAPSSATPAERQQVLLHQLIVSCEGSYTEGTRTDRMQKGLLTFLKSHGYPTAIVRYFSWQDNTLKDLELLNRNREDTVGILLCVDFVNKKSPRWYQSTGTAGHCITLLNYNKGQGVVLDPAHAEGGRGRYPIHFVRVENATIFQAPDSYNIPALYELEGEPVEHHGFNATILDSILYIEMPSRPVTPTVVGKTP